MPAAYTYKLNQAPTVEPPAPIVTGILVLLCVWAFFEATSHGSYGTHVSLWLMNHGFSGGKFQYHVFHGIWDKDLAMMWNATFAQASLWQLLGSIYFLWVFGSTVESRLGSIRYLPLLVVSTVLSYCVLGNEVKTLTPFYVGPGLMTAALIGMYLNFFPEKKINPGGQIRSYKIFKTEKDPNPAEQFGISPWWLILGFVVFEVVLHFMFQQLPIKFGPMTIMSAFAALLIGFTLSFLLVVAATGKLKGNPMKQLAVERYQQMRRLDMTHDQAVNAVAKLLSVPDEQVRQWVTSGGGPLPQA